MTHAGCLNGCKMLTADVKDFCQLLLRIPLFLAIVSDCIGEIFHAFRKVKIPFQSYHRLTELVYPKAALTKINPKALLTLNKRHYIITTLFCWHLYGRINMIRTLTCAITSHRPTRFRFKYDENNNGCKRIKKRIRDQLIQLYEQGFRQFWVGGALGVDMWAGEILLRLKEQLEYSEIQLMIALPFEGHDANWEERSRRRMAFLIKHSTETVIVGEKGSSTATNYRRRNEYMVDHADCLLAVYDNDRSIRSGTGMTVNYARKQGLPIILIHPDTAAVSRESFER